LSRPVVRAGNGRLDQRVVNPFESRQRRPGALRLSGAGGSQRVREGGDRGSVEEALPGQIRLRRLETRGFGPAMPLERVAGRNRRQRVARGKARIVECLRRRGFLEDLPRLRLVAFLQVGVFQIVQRVESVEGGGSRVYPGG